MNNAVDMGQDMAWSLEWKYKGNCVCVCKYIWQSFLFMNETLAMQQCSSYGTKHGLTEYIREIVCVCVSTFDNLFSLWTKHYAIMQ